MTLQFDGERFRDLTATYQFIFSDIDNGYPIYIAFSEGKSEFHEGLAKNPTITITSPCNVWLDISGGLRNPIWALLTKKYTFKGEFSYLKLLPKLTTKKITVPKSKAFLGRWESPSKVLVIIGNPRKKNGLTYFYLQSFLEGMKRSGARIEEICLYDKEIKPCLGCFACWTRTPGICTQKDDQGELLEKLNQAELIIYALPLYFHSMPGLVKTHLDRQLPMVYPFMEKFGGSTVHPRRVSVKQSMILFSICGFPELHNFEPLIATFKNHCKVGNISLIEEILIPGAMELYYNPTNRTNLLKKISLLDDAGEQIIKNGVLKRKTRSEILKPTASIDKWLDGANLYWHDELHKLVE